jgi:1,4-dihydroxy-2-naphthoyl-CoA hydrolase
MDVVALADLMPLLRTLEIELTEASSELVSARMAWAPERCTAGGVLHGGALMALADSCGGICAYLNMPDGASGTATIESKTNLFRPVTSGAATAMSRPLHRGRTIAVIETELTTDDGRPAAKTIQTQVFHFPRQ